MFFSVKVPMKIGGKVFRTCVCYDLTETLRATVEKLASEGKAEIYAELKFFCNGKLVEKKCCGKAERSCGAEDKPKKGKKAKAVQAKEEETAAEPVNEVDESEGF